MSKKKLPNVIRPTIDGTPEVAAGNGNDWRAAPAGMMVSNQLVGATAATESAPMVHVVETVRPSPSSDTLTPTPAISVFPAVDAAKRRAQARAIVERHATYSAVGGVLPLPIASVAGITTIIIRMVKMLSSLYGVPFERDRAGLEPDAYVHAREMVACAGARKLVDIHYLLFWTDASKLISQC